MTTQSSVQVQDVLDILSEIMEPDQESLEDGNSCDARCLMTKRLELARHRLIRWNHFEVGDIFGHFKRVEADITVLQRRED